MDMDIMVAMDKLNKKPKLNTNNDFEVTEFGDIRKHLCSKQTITIDAADKKDLIKLLPEHLLLFYRRLKNTCKSDDYSNLADAYGALEYFGSFNVASASRDYLKYMKNNISDAVINVYGVERAASLPGLIKPKLKDMPYELPDYHCDVPKTIKYSMFESTQYNVIENKDICSNPIYVLNVNLPHEYYSSVQLLDYIYCYDIINKDFWFTGSSRQETDDLLLDICKNGITNPLYLEIDNGTIVSTRDSNTRILLALYLKLPYIPVSLYATSENIDYFETLIDKKNANKELINSICDPYFVF
jgi:hypothetical protein